MSSTLLAVLQLVTAAVVATYWLTWFRQEHAQPWLPAGYVSHERAFVWSDGLLSLLLVASAVLLLAGEPLGRSIGLVCAGMLAFLGVLDAAYFAREGMFARERDGVLNAAVVVGTLTAAVVLFAGHVEV